MKRRPHWDDDLIEAVRALTRTCPYEDYNCEVDDAQTYDVIAAVEDWHKAKRDSRDRTHSAECWRWHQECAEHLIERQRSTAQRVRDVCMSSHVDDKGKRVVFLDRIQRALDGDGDA